MGAAAVVEGQTCAALHSVGLRAPGGAAGLGVEAVADGHIRGMPGAGKGIATGVGVDVDALGFEQAVGDYDFGITGINISHEATPVTAAFAAQRAVEDAAREIDGTGIDVAHDAAGINLGAFADGDADAAVGDIGGAAIINADKASGVRGADGDGAADVQVLDGGTSYRPEGSQALA